MILISVYTILFPFSSAQNREIPRAPHRAEHGEGFQISSMIKQRSMAMTAVRAVSITAVDALALPDIAHHAPNVEDQRHCNDCSDNDCCNHTKIPPLFHETGQSFLKNPKIVRTARIISTSRMSRMTTSTVLTVRFTVIDYTPAPTGTASAARFLFGSGRSSRYRNTIRTMIAATVPMPKLSSPVNSPPN